MQRIAKYTFEYFGLFGKKVWVLKRSTICFVYTIFKVNGRYKLFERTFLASEKMYICIVK